MVCREGILYKGTLARNPRGSRCRRIDEDEISTPVAVNQRAANCLGEAVRSFTAAGANQCILASPSTIHCQFFELFGARRSTASKLASLWNCSPAHKLLLRGRKILLLEGL
ncbi:uncharacterized protein TNCV_1275031 [Trichonephila clavipes]|nr:uncharacterized protein TNCV_1275031 [Trichonephila clavipes]